MTNLYCLIVVTNLLDQEYFPHVGGADHDARVHVVCHIRHVTTGTPLYQIFGVDHQFDKRPGELSCKYVINFTFLRLR